MWSILVRLFWVFAEKNLIPKWWFQRGEFERWQKARDEQQNKKKTDVALKMKSRRR